MDCPKPHCYGTGKAGDYATELDHNQIHATGHFGREHPLLGLASLAFMGVKLALSTTYKCQSCGHVWRKWG